MSATKGMILGMMLLVSGCLSTGDIFNFQMNRGRTSGVIKNTTLKLEVTNTTQQDTEVKLTIYVKPILGGATTREEVKVLSNALASTDNLAALRSGEVIHSDEAWVQHAGYNSNHCDLLKFDHIPDTQDTQDMVVVATLCGAGLVEPNVPAIDINVTAQGRRVQIGYDAVH